MPGLPAAGALAERAGSGTLPLWEASGASADRRALRVSRWIPDLGPDRSLEGVVEQVERDADTARQSEERLRRDRKGLHRETVSRKFKRARHTRRKLKAKTKRARRRLRHAWQEAEQMTSQELVERICEMAANDKEIVRDATILGQRLEQRDLALRRVLLAAERGLDELRDAVQEEREALSKEVS